jgi:hypothetical protein
MILLLILYTQLGWQVYACYKQLFIDWDGVLKSFCLGWPWTAILLISTCQTVFPSRIIGGMFRVFIGVHSVGIIDYPWLSSVSMRTDNTWPEVSNKDNATRYDTNHLEAMGKGQNSLRRPTSLLHAFIALKTLHWTTANCGLDHSTQHLIRYSILFFSVVLCVFTYSQLWEISEIFLIYLAQFKSKDNLFK